MSIKLNDEFMWGGATASYQAEGGWDADDKGYSNWDHFSNSEDNEFNLNNVSGNDAANFYRDYKEYIKLLAEGGHNAFRFSLTWTRIIPDGVGERSQAGIDFYNDVIDTCLEYGLEPSVTIHHYDIPQRFEDEFGGWLDRKLIDYYFEYAKVCLEEFGDRVKVWSTINEPKFYSYCGYVMGNWPPHRHKDLQSFWVTAYNQMVASAKIVKHFKENDYDGYIGLVHDHNSIEVAPETENKEYVYEHAELFYNGIVLDMCAKGKIPENLEKFLEDTGYDTSFIDYTDNDILKDGIVDYLGVNSYQRQYVTDSSGVTVVTHNNKGKESDEIEAMKLKDWFDIAEDPNTVRNHWGREVYPEAVYNGIKDVAEKYPGIPMMVTENGHAVYDDPDENDYVEDDERIEVLSEFIKYVLKAREDGYDVQGYFIWSAFDVWSWVNGYVKRYGLIRVDAEQDFKKTPKKSYYWYKDLIEKNQIKL